MRKLLRHAQSRKEQGFTVPELMVVILIIGIIAAITVPAFTMQRKNSQDGKVKSDISHAQNIIETWIIKHPSSKIPSGKITKDLAQGSAIVVDATLTNRGLNEFKVTNGTELTITGSSENLGNYTITGKNDKGNRANPANGGLVYDSLTGKYK